MFHIINNILFNNGSLPKHNGLIFLDLTKSHFSTDNFVLDTSF